ncbi:MAG: A/G-specific adenine glycosylase [Clostridia bacterium]|nr:A/G-specific adenine glycosylase [Clostridia bacterium]
MYTIPPIAEPLSAWFAENRRALPWREDRDPYHVWISEIMLQQTRIEAVKKYYARFTEALPDIRALSECPEEKLLKLWEGLGYYSRARNLQKAARMIVTEFGGRFPEHYADIVKLPGVGEYTAGAVASLCFNEKVTAVDGNVLRVLSRLTGDRRNVLLPETKKAATKELAAVLPEQPGAFNEALMELGELVCLPNGVPLCGRCPLREMCAACRDGLTEELPVREKQTKRRKEEKTVLLIEDGEGRIAIEKRKGPGLLSGMYQFPNVNGFLTETEIGSLVKEWGMEPLSAAFYRDAKHVFTHIDWLMKGWRVRVQNAGDRFLWVSPRELAETYPLPTAFKPFLQ